MEHLFRSGISQAFPDHRNGFTQVVGELAEALYINNKMNEGKSFSDAVKSLLDAYKDDNFDLLDPSTWDEEKRKSKHDPCKLLSA